MPCPHQVGLKKANAFGLYDMHRNVREWCQDRYAADYYSASPTDNSMSPAAHVGPVPRVGRGGGTHAASGRLASRYGGSPDYRIDFMGFRVARSQSGQ